MGHGGDVSFTQPDVMQPRYVIFYVNELGWLNWEYCGALLTHLCTGTPSKVVVNVSATPKELGCEL
jgi:hypothetical protein